MQRLIAFIAVAVLLAAIPAIAAKWIPSQFLTSPTQTDVSAGGINGLAGAINPWVETSHNGGLGSSYMLSEDGRVGARWDGDQYDRVNWLNDNSRTQIYDNVKHEWWASDGVGKRRIKVELTTDTGASGSATASILNEDWWWDTFVEIEDSEPTVRAWNNEEGGWEDIEVTVIDAYDHIGVRDVGGSPIPGRTETLAATLEKMQGEQYHTEGSYEARSGVINPDDYALVLVRYWTFTQANRTCDNASVFTWEFWLESTVKSTSF